MASKYTFCSMYFVICLFTPQLVYGERSCLQGRLEPPAAQVWRRRNSSKPREVLIFPMKEMDACLHDGWQMGKGRLGEWDYEQLLKFPLYWTFMKNCPAVTWNFQMMNGVRYMTPKFFFRSNLLCKEQPVRKPMSPVARPKGACP